jgi:hypothetical protein
MLFFEGVKIFISSVFLVFSRPELLQWFRKVSFFCLGLALTSILILMVGGAHLIANLGKEIWFDLGAILWAILLFFFSGTLTATLMSFLLGIFGNEEALMRALTQNPSLMVRGFEWSWRWREIWAALTSLLCALIAAPLLFFPPLLPLGLLILAWGLGGELLRCARRILAQSGLSRRKASLKVPLALRLGIGLGPALMSLVPVLAWFLWPLALVTAIRAALSLEAGRLAPKSHDVER